LFFYISSIWVEGQELRILFQRFDPQSTLFVLLFQEVSSLFPDPLTA